MEEEFQKLVYIRWQTFPSGYSLSIGDYGTVTKEEALEHIAEKDEIGKLLIQIDRNYFDKIKSGALYANSYN